MNEDRGWEHISKPLARVIEKAVRAALDGQQKHDGRSLRATGRTEQFNFRTKPELKESIHKAAAAAGITVAEWMEQAASEKLRAEVLGR